jgi:hypothetical protein
MRLDTAIPRVDPPYIDSKWRRRDAAAHPTMVAPSRTWGDDPAEFDDLVEHACDPYLAPGRAGRTTMAPKTSPF